MIVGARRWSTPIRPRGASPSNRQHSASSIGWTSGPGPALVRALSPRRRGTAPSSLTGRVSAGVTAVWLQPQELRRLPPGARPAAGPPPRAARGPGPRPGCGPCGPRRAHPRARAAGEACSPRARSAAGPGAGCRPAPATASSSRGEPGEEVVVDGRGAAGAASAIEDAGPAVVRRRERGAVHRAEQQDVVGSSMVAFAASRCCAHTARRRRRSAPPHGWSRRGSRAARRAVGRSRSRTCRRPRSGVLLGQETPARTVSPEPRAGRVAALLPELDDRGGENRRGAVIVRVACHSMAARARNGNAGQPGAAGRGGGHAARPAGLRGDDGQRHRRRGRGAHGVVLLPLPAGGRRRSASRRSRDGAVRFAARLGEVLDRQACPADALAGVAEWLADELGASGWADGCPIATTALGVRDQLAAPPCRVGGGVRAVARRPGRAAARRRRPRRRRRRPGRQRTRPDRGRRAARPRRGARAAAPRGGRTAHPGVGGLA